jgi:hypothetical protein
MTNDKRKPISIEEMARKQTPPSAYVLPRSREGGPPGVVVADGQPLEGMSPVHRDPVDAKPARRKRGRPPGSRTKSKAT